MKNNRISVYSRILLIGSALALVAVLYTPMWRIDLNAPQYPEGLNLLIFAHKLGGNVDIINGLNHYIGMKTLHTEDFVEFRILPILIWFFVGAFLVAGILGRRKWMNLLFILFVLFGITAMYDFWRWEYNYGHNLNPDAAIIVPGMSYQPPLIGFKQLLNFGAYSTPDTGGWIFLSVGATLLLLVILEWWKVRKAKKAGKAAMALSTLFLMFTLNSCSPSPEQITAGRDNCSFCKMGISDMHYACELVTHKSKVFKFDDTHCLLAFIKAGGVEKKDIHSVYFSDYDRPGTLLGEKEALLFQGDCFRGPMGGNTAAFKTAEEMKKNTATCNGKAVKWAELNP